MDHKEQHHEKHRKEREETKQAEKPSEPEQDRKRVSFQAAWYPAGCIRSRAGGDKRTARGRGPSKSRGLGFAVEWREDKDVAEPK
jgi:hypothetical protein